jgi:RHS repeat-associated protein
MYYDDNSPWAPHTTPPGNGVMMAEGNLVASYNALNQPVAMIPTGSSNIYWFGYDPLGRCVKRVVGPSIESGTATYFYYDGWSLIQEGPSATAFDRLYMLGNRVDEIVADYAVTNGQWMFHHSEGRSHNMLLTAANGNLAEQNEYDAFGRPYFFDAAGQPQTASNFGNRFLFTGREYLSELKLYDYRARMYQPELGRFMQPDPEGFEGEDFNLYRYCGNDPINFVDPFGLIRFMFADDFPRSAQPGVNRALKLFRNTARGKELDKDPRLVIIRPTTPTQGTGHGVGASSGRDYLFLNPHDSLFLDAASKRAFARYPNEMPPVGDKGRAVIIGHESGHFGGEKDESKGGRNVEKNENPIRRDLGIRPREKYEGHSVKPAPEEKKPEPKPEPTLPPMPKIEWWK